MSKPVLACILVAGAVACTKAPPFESTGTTRAFIQGGTVDTTHSFAVGISSTSGSGSICSATLIAPNLVLTARHCIDVAPPVTVCGSAPFGLPVVGIADLYVTTNSVLSAGSGRHAVAKIERPAINEQCGYDLALLILNDVVASAEAVPATPLVQRSMTDHSRYSTSFAALGYGKTDGTAGAPFGTRRVLSGVGIVCIPGDPSIPCGALVGNGLSAEEFYAGGGTCPGDSGSGAYEQASFDANAPVTMGILSRGRIDEAGVNCTDAVYERTDAHRNLIVAAALEAAQRGSYPAPPWTQLLPVQDAAIDARDASTPPPDATEDASATLDDAGEESAAIAGTNESACAVGRTPPGWSGSWFGSWFAAAALALARRWKRGSAHALPVTHARDSSHSTP